MLVLRKGTRHPSVELWEHFLLGLYPDCDLVVDDLFNDDTDRATRRFQKDVGFSGQSVDGVVGRMTYAKAMEQGFNPGIIDDREKGPNWPPKPTNLSPLYGTAREDVFGKFSYVPAPSKYNPEGIRITDDWQKTNITKVHVRQLVGVRGAPSTGNIFFHVKAADQLVAMFQAWDDAGLGDRVISWAGSWVPRFIRGSRTKLSNHSWATAFDINVPWNGLGVEPALVGKKGSVRELVAIANEHGFFWGGHYRTRPDGMHFECCKLL